MGWTFKDNMVDGLFFCATLTGSREGHSPSVQAGAETSDSAAMAVMPDPGFSWKGHSERVGAHHFPYTIVPAPHEQKQLHESEYNSHESEMVPTTDSILTQKQVGCR